MSKARVFAKHPGKADTKHSACAPSHGHEPERPLHPVLQLQRTIGNRATGRLLDAIEGARREGGESGNEIAASAIFQLQRAIGNQAAIQLLQEMLGDNPPGH